LTVNSVASREEVFKSKGAATIYEISRKFNNAIGYLQTYFVTICFETVIRKEVGEKVLNNI